MKVLIVDDSPPFRERVRRHLNEAEGILVVGEAEDGLSAVREVERLRPDVVLLDLHMPGVDGFRVLRHVKERFAGMTVVVLTSDASEIVRQRCVVLRADAVMDKRDATANLLPALRELFARRLV